ncbi:MAG TPA: DoxX family protein [Cyclobacteriaceae bacterium]|nr:DoxX family protein [Cyclobacteriaceae bacterium]
MTQYRDLAILLLRIATAANFLSPVADRFGWWGAPGDAGVAWGSWPAFVEYTGQVNSFAPAGMIPFLAATATALEIFFALFLLIGFKTRLAATGSAVLTFLFAVSMAISFGIKTPLDYAVFVDFTSAFLLATVDRYKWSVDEMLSKK